MEAKHYYILKINKNHIMEELYTVLHHQQKDLHMIQSI